MGQCGTRIDLADGCTSDIRMYNTGSYLQHTVHTRAEEKKRKEDYYGVLPMPCVCILHLYPYLVLDSTVRPHT